jgi:drug/metabolite transporter (DMT)-like permease
MGHFGRAPRVVSATAKHPALIANAGLVASGLLSGAAVVATRVAVQSVPPLSLAVLRYAQGGLILGLCLLLVAPSHARVCRQDYKLLAVLGILLFAAFPLLFNAGLRLTEASRGSLMLATVPVWSALLGRLTGQERLIPRQLAGLALATAGVAVAVAERGLGARDAGNAVLGDALILLAALCGAAYGVLVKRLSGRYTALTVTTYAMLIGTFVLLPAALVEGLPAAARALDDRNMLLVLFLGILGGAVVWYLYGFALSRLSPTQVAVYVNLNPLAAMALATILLGERVTGPVVLGFAMVLGGVTLMNWPQRAPAASAP